MANVYLDICGACWKYTGTNALGEAWKSGEKDLPASEIDSSVKGCLGLCDERNYAIVSRGDADNTIIFNKINTPPDVRAVQNYAADTARNGRLGELPDGLAEKVFICVRDGRIEQHPFFGTDASELAEDLTRNHFEWVRRLPEKDYR